MSESQAVGGGPALLTKVRRAALVAVVAGAIYHSGTGEVTLVEGPLFRLDRLGMY